MFLIRSPSHGYKAWTVSRPSWKLSYWILQDGYRCLAVSVCPDLICSLSQGYYAALVHFWLCHAPDEPSSHGRDTLCRVSVYRRRLSLELQQLVTLRNSLCLHCEPSIMFAVAPAGLQEPYEPGELVGVDLDCNLLHKQKVGQFKMKVTQAPAVQQWVQDKTAAAEFVSSVRVGGAVYTALPPRYVLVV